MSALRRNKRQRQQINIYFRTLKTNKMDQITFDILAIGIQSLLLLFLIAMIIIAGIHLIKDKNN